MDIANEKQSLMQRGVEKLATDIVNEKLNRLISQYADEGNEEHEKLVPYIGWYWRWVDFAGDDPYIPIGHCGEFVGFMENNKWDYPERGLTQEEVDQVREIVCTAYDLSAEGGALSDIIQNTKDKLAELWPLMQTFEIQKSGYWIYGPQGQVGHADTRETADFMIVSLQEAAPGLRYWKEEV
jgi:hypothetical protein